jgi:acetylornithine/succinyldiaminopimelate/putrescine aminotransferase
MGDEYWRNAFRPLLPGVAHLRYNRDDDLEQITEKTAAVFAETVQAENGVIKPRPAWMKLVRKRCDDTGALLILDEIQAGFGRTGKLWGFEEYEIVPDILMLGKALGGGLPLGAFISSKKRMDAFTENPVLGNISTFGGHPLSCAAGLASFRVLFKESLVTQVAEKEKRFRQALAHPHIKDVRSAGLLIAVEFESAETCKRIVDKCIRDGVLTDWFLFAPHCLRIAPPLTVSTEEIDRICEVVIRHL